MKKTLRHIIKKTLRRSFFLFLLCLLPACTGTNIQPQGNAGGYEGRVPNCLQEACPTYIYAGSGSDWRWSLNADGTFDANELTSPSQIGGIYKRLPSGFVKLVVMTASGTGAPAPGTIRYGLELPSITFLVQSILSWEKGIITTVGSGKCPDRDFTSNWILTQYPFTFDMSDPSANVFGTFAWNQAGSFGSLPSQFAIAGDYHSNGPASFNIPGVCSNGIMPSVLNGLPATMYLGAPGSAVVKFLGVNAVLALPASHLTAAGDLAGEYAGLIINLNDLLFPVRAVQGKIDSNGGVVVDGLLNVEPVTVDPFYNGTAKFDALNAPSDGFAEVTVTTGAGKGKMACMVVPDIGGSRRNVLFCVGQAPGAAGMDRYAYNLLLVSK